MFRYGAWPAFAQERLAWTADGRISYKLKRRWPDGRTHLVMEPVAFLRRLVGIIPQPRRDLVRYSGFSGPASKHRAKLRALVPTEIDAAPKAASVAAPVRHHELEVVTDPALANTLLTAARRNQDAQRERARRHALAARAVTGHRDDRRLADSHPEPIASTAGGPGRSRSWPRVHVAAPMAAYTGVMKLPALLVLACGCKGGDKAATAPTSSNTPAPTPALAPTPDAAVFTDEPLGPGACAVVSVKEMSEIAGTQLKYSASTDNPTYPCNLHSVDKAAAITLSVDASGNISPQMVKSAAVPDVGEKADWDGDALMFMVAGKVYRVRMADHRDDGLKPQTVAAAKLIVPRLAKMP